MDWMFNDEIGHLKPTTKHTLLIGSFAQVMAFNDHLVDLALLGLLHTNQRHGGAAIRHIGLNQKRDLIKLIVADTRGRDSEAYKAVSDVLRTLEDASNQRNNRLHAMYNTGEDGIDATLYKKGKLEPVPTDADLEEIENEIDLAMRAGEKLLDLIKKGPLFTPAPTREDYIDALVKALQDQIPDQIQPESIPPPDKVQD